MKNIFDWNHISDRLTEDQIDELKVYYALYHKIKNTVVLQGSVQKKLRKSKLTGDISSVIFATGGITSAVATSGVGLVAISAVSVLI